MAIRDAWRGSDLYLSVRPLAAYFIMGGRIYQSPDVYTLLSNRLVSPLLFLSEIILLILDLNVVASLLLRVFLIVLDLHVVWILLIFL